MKRKNLKPMIISTLLAVGCAATTAGTTFALFADRGDTTIEVIAGKVELKVQFSNLTSYSLDEEDNTQQIPVSVEGAFASNTIATYLLRDFFLFLTYFKKMVLLNIRIM